MASIDQRVLDLIQPVVLVGGRSSRFGRDKLLEPINGSPLVTIAIGALRAIFGPRVALVGRCDPRVAALGDRVIDDPYPGLGPVGGICAALEHEGTDIVVCAGDLIAIDEDTIRAVVAASIESPDALAYLAHASRLHPTIGLYRAGSLASFQSAIRSGMLRLASVLEGSRVVRVPVSSAAVRNINRPDEVPLLDPPSRDYCQGG